MPRALTSQSYFFVPSRACETVLRPRSSLVDFNEFYCNSKVMPRGHEFRHENTGTRAQGTKARVLDMLEKLRDSLKEELSCFPRSKIIELSFQNI